MRRLLVAALALVALVAGACGSTQSSAPRPAPLTGISHAAYQIAPISLTASNGKPYVLAKDTTKPLTLVFYGYTHCTDDCPIVMSALSAAMTRLDAADRKDVDVVFVTTDPARDSPPVLRRYLDRYNPSFFGLTGSLHQIVKLSQSMHIYVGAGEKLPSGGRDLNAHDTHVSGILSTGEATMIWDVTTSPKQYADDIHTLLEKARA